MANPLLLDIVTYLKTQGIVADDGVDAFRDFSPENPDNIVALFEYTGDPAVYYESAVNRSVQITVRNTVANDARQKARDIFEALRSDDARIDFTPARWGLVYLRQPPFRIDTDTRNRVIYGFNVGITTTID